DARERWTALQRFYQAHRHFLVTNGPYHLDSWSADGAVLGVFRDFSYPLGVGSYDRYAIPRRAYVARVEARGERLDVHADVEVVARFPRGSGRVRQSFTGTAAPETPECGFVAVGADGRVVRAGTAPHAGHGLYTLDARGASTIAVAFYLGGNHASPEARL